jgi:hypothetical protein
MKHLISYMLVPALLGTLVINTTYCSQPTKDLSSTYTALHDKLQTQWESLKTHCAALWQNHKQAVIISAATVASCGGALGCYYYQKQQQTEGYIDQIAAWWDANPSAKLFAFLGGILVVVHILPDEDTEKSTPELKEAQQQ